MNEIEVELKYKIDSVEDISKKLVDLGFGISKPRTYELSIMYDNIGQIMQKTDGRIRVRQTGEETEFCYKKPITREGIKKEIEYETLVSNRVMLEKILEMMEFNQTTSYERFRTEMKKDGVKATIDEYPFATFLEIEGEDNGILDISKKLGFDQNDNLTDSCDTLFTQWRIANGLPSKPHMRFDDYQR